MFVAIMMLSLGTGFALLAYQVASTELEISRYTESEAASLYLAESGVEKVISWLSNPAASPNPAVFSALPETGCSNNPESPDLSLDPDYLSNPDGPFKALKGMGRIVQLDLYGPTHDDGICTVLVTAESNNWASKTVKVELTSTPLGVITAGIQGKGNAANPSPIWLHWGDIRYTGDVNLGGAIGRVPKKDETIPVTGLPYLDDPLDDDDVVDPWVDLYVENDITAPPRDDPAANQPFLLRANVWQHGGEDVVLDSIDIEALKHFIKQHGEFYLVNPEGKLERAGSVPKTFAELFQADESSRYRLVWIDVKDGYSSEAPLVVSHGPYKGYFYFAGDVQVENLDGDVLAFNAFSPKKSDGTGPFEVFLSDINLDGLFFVQGTLDIQYGFKAFGAIYAKNGFTGPGADDLEVWYNTRFASAAYPGIRLVTPLAGTWKTLPVM